MNRYILILLLILCNRVYAQESNNVFLVKFAKAYKDFMFRNEMPNETVKELKAMLTDETKVAGEFILQTLTSGNKITSRQYLTRPENNSLKQIYIIHALSRNERKENRIDENKLIDSLNNQIISDYELLDIYYGMLFTAVGNKNQPFNLSKMNLKLEDYELKDQTERAILYLRCMEMCNATIWGYMNIVTPPNTEKAMTFIKKFPKFNGRPYYQFTDVYFGDFEKEIIEDKGKQSYKAYYLNKYFELLLSHLICLNREKASDKELNDLLLGSILRERDLYKYTKYKPTLEKMFKVERKVE